MNILLLYSDQIVPSSHSWYCFYEQLVYYLNDHEQISSLHVCAIKLLSSENSKMFGYDDRAYNFLLLPDSKCFNTSKNRKVIIDYIIRNEIDVIFNLMHPNMDLNVFLFFVKRNVHCQIFNLIHSRPDLGIYNKCYQIKHEKCYGKGLKMFLQKNFFSLYIFMLKCWIRILYLISYNVNDAVILLSNSYMEIYRKMLGLKSMNRIFAVPNPMPQIESEISIERKKNQIIFVEHLIEIKAVHRLLLIWHSIEDELLDWDLVIVGDGPQYSYLKSLVETRNMKRVYFKGKIDSISLIDQSKILALVSTFEGLPTVFLEAMALGVIPVGYDTFPSIYDLIDDGESGYIVPFENKEEYAKVLLKIAKNDKLRQKMAENAKKKSEKFSINEIGRIWIDIFNSMKRYESP